MPFDYMAATRLTNPMPTSWDPVDPEEDLWKQDQQGLPSPPAIPMGGISNPSASFQPGPVQPPPLTSAPPTLQPKIPNPLAGIKAPRAMGGVSPAPTLSTDRVDTPDELRLKMAQAQSVRPMRGMYERGGVRGVLGKIIQATAPLAGAFGINPSIVAQGGEALEAPGYNRAMGEWAQRTGALQQAQDESQQWEKLQNERAYHNAITANTAANQAALAESRRQSQLQREEGMRAEEMARLRQQDWRPLPSITSPALSIPSLSAGPGVPLVNALPARPMTMPSQQTSLGVEPGFIPASMPRSRFSPEMIAGQIPTDETAARLKAEEVSKAQLEPVDEVALGIIRQFGGKAVESLPLPQSGTKVPKDENARLRGYADLYQRNKLGQERLNFSFTMPSLSQPALDLMSKLSLMTGHPVIPPRSPGAQKTWLANMENMAKMAGNTDVVNIISNARSLQTALTQQMGIQSKLKTFENTALKNVAMMEKYLPMLADPGSPLANQPVRSLKKNLWGDKYQPAFEAATSVAVNEIAGILRNMGSGSGVVSDSAREEVLKMVDKNYTVKQMVEVLSVLKQDLANRRAAGEETIRGLQQQLGALAPGMAISGETSQPSPSRSGGGGDGTITIRHKKTGQTQKIYRSSWDNDPEFEIVGGR